VAFLVSLLVLTLLSLFLVSLLGFGVLSLFYIKHIITTRHRINGSKQPMTGRG